MDAITRHTHARQRLAKASNQLAQTRAEFALAIIEAHKAGLPYRTIAEDVGLSHQRVAQIVHGK